MRLCKLSTLARLMIVALLALSGETAGGAPVIKQRGR